MGLFGRNREVGELNERVASTLESAYGAYEHGDYETSSRKFRLALDYLMVENELSTQVHITNDLVVDIAEIFNMTVHSFNNIGRYDESISLLETYGGKFKNSRRVLLMKANVYAAKGERSSELEVYNLLLKIDKKDTGAYIRKAELLHGLKRADDREIREILNRAAKYQKASDTGSCVKLASAYRRLLGDPDSAQYVLERISTKRPSGEMLVEQAEIHLAREDSDKAVEILEKALELDHGHTGAFGTMVRAYQRKGDYQKAREGCEKGLRINPSDPDLRRAYRELSGDSGLLRKVKEESTYL